MGKIEELIEEYRKQIEDNMKYIKGEWACEADRISGMKIAVDVLRKVVKDLQVLKSSLPTTEITELQAWKKIAEVTDTDEPKFNPAAFYHDMRILFKKADFSEPVRGGKTLYDNGYRIVHESSLPTQQDKVVVPEFIKRTMAEYGSLQEMLTEEYYSNSIDEIDNDTVQCWIDDNFDLLCRAWLNKSDNKLKLQFPKSVVDWLGTPKEEDHDELLSYIMQYYWNEDSAYDDTVTSEVGKYLVESLSNVVKLLRAVEGESYTVEKEQLYEVRLPFEQWDEDSAELKTKIVILAYDLTSGETRYVNKGSKFLSLDYETKLNEERIKLIDERYWAFAVPVEEEAE